MKKFLLSLVALLTLSAANANIVENFADASWLPTAEDTQAREYTSASTGIVYTLYACKKGTYNKVSYLQVSGKNYTGAYISFALPEGTQAIVAKTGQNASTNVTITVTVGETAIAENLKLAEKDADFTINVPADLQNSKGVCKIMTTNKYNAQFQSLTFVTDGETPVDPDPVDPDPVDPTDNKMASIQALIDANKDLAVGATSSDEFILDFPVTVIYSNGVNNYVTDGKNNLLIYTDLKKEGLENGSVLPAGIKGKYQNYNTVPELKNVDLATVGEPTAGKAVDPISVSLEDATAEGVSAYVKIEGVSVSAISGKNFTITDANDNTVAGYNTFSIGLAEAQNVTIIGFVNYYKDYQISPVSITAADGKETVATPTFNPAAGALLAGTKVNIYTNTADAAIYYTTDGTEPTTASTLYTTAVVINEALTLKAIAVKEGMNDSKVAEAAYTIKQPADATFNFAAPATLTPAYPADKEDESLEADGTNGFFANVSDVAFTDGDVSVTSTKGSSTDARLYYQTGGKIQLRVYNGGSTVIASTNPAKKISKIVFTYNNGSTSSNKVQTPATGTWTAAEGTWTGSESTVTFNYSGTQQINAIEVTLTEEASIDEIAADGENAPAEYYNLQGVRVDNPANGLYIKKQGSKVTKVIVK